MKPALILFSVLTSLSLGFATQGTQPIVCRGKPLPITLLPGPKMTGPSLPLRFGGTREFPRPPINSFRSEKGFRLVIKTRDEFSDFWKRFTGEVSPSNGVPPFPEVDFAKEMVVVAAMGQRPTSGYWIIIDGACEVDGQVEVFVSNVEDVKCSGTLQTLTYPADAVRLPQTDLPVVFRETQVSCTEWFDKFLRFPRGTP
jgi:PrcB C-terminal